MLCGNPAALSSDVQTQYRFLLNGIAAAAGFSLSARDELEKSDDMSCH